MSRILSTLAPSAFSLEFVLCIFASAGDAIFLPLLCMPLARCRGDRRVEGRGMGGHYYECSRAAIYRWSTNGGGSSNRSSRTGACNNLRLWARELSERGPCLREVGFARPRGIRITANRRRGDSYAPASRGAASSAPTPNWAMHQHFCGRRARHAVPLPPARLAVEEGAEACVACPAYWELCTVCEHGDVAVFSVRLDPSHAFQVDDVGAVDAHEAGRVQRGFQAGDSLLLQVLFAFGGQVDVIVLCFGIFQLRDGNDEHAGAVAHRDAVEELRRRTSGNG